MFVSPGSASGNPNAGLYDPATDSWQLASLCNQSFGPAVYWTGTGVYAWGGAGAKAAMFFPP